MLKIILLFIASIVGMIIGYIYGPASSLPNAVIINDYYFEVMRNHYFVVGLVAGIFACITGFITNSSLKSIAITLLLSGIVINTIGQSGEPDFLEYFISGLLEFMFPYIFGVVIVISIYILIHLTLGRNTKSG